MEAQQAGDAREEILVEWDDCRERTAGRCLAQPQPMLSGRIGDDDMAPLDPGQIGEQRAERARIDGFAFALILGLRISAPQR